MLENVDILTVIRYKMADFSKGQRAIARYILSDYDKVAFISAKELAGCAGVSEATVVRFAYSLGYGGYPELQRELSDYISQKLRTKRLIELDNNMLSSSDIFEQVTYNDIDNIKKSYEIMDEAVIKQAVDMLMKARRIYVVGVRECAFIGGYLNYCLIQMGFKVSMLDMDNQRLLLDRLYESTAKDVIFAISFPNYSKATLKALEYASDKNVGIITLSNSTSSPVRLYSSCNLVACSRMSVALESITASLMVVNAIIMSIKVADREDINNRDKGLRELYRLYQIDYTDELDYNE